MITNFIKPHMGSWYLIILLEITVQSSAMDVCTVTFSNWLLEVIISNFVFGQPLSKPPWLGNIPKIPVPFKPELKHYTAQTLVVNFIPKLSFETRSLYIINYYYTKPNVCSPWTCCSSSNCNFSMFEFLYDWTHSFYYAEGMFWAVFRIVGTKRAISFRISWFWVYIHRNLVSIIVYHNVMKW